MRDAVACVSTIGSVRARGVSAQPTMTTTRTERRRYFILRIDDYYSTNASPTHRRTIVRSTVQHTTHSAIIIDDVITSQSLVQDLAISRNIFTTVKIEACRHCGVSSAACVHARSRLHLHHSYRPVAVGPSSLHRSRCSSSSTSLCRSNINIRSD